MASRRSRHVAIFVATILVGGGTLSGPANAQRPTEVPKIERKHPPGYAVAKQLFIEGVNLFNGGDYPRAIVKFKASLKHYANPKVYARIALCHKWLGNRVKALVSYERFLKEFPTHPTRPQDQKLRLDVGREIKKLLKQVARLKISVPAPAGAEVRVDGRVLGRAPLTREIRLEPGTANVTVTAKGYYPFRRDVMLLANQTATVEATLIKIKIKVIRKVVHIRHTPLYKRWWFWTAVGALLAGGATGLAVGLTAKPPTRDLDGLPIHISTLARW